MAAKVRALQEWCRRQCDGYRDVNVTNLTSSWKSGLAFCAIIHRYRPDLIDYDSLKKEDVFENNKLAFDVASEELGIPALLDPEDMVIMTVPDKLCIVTYVAQYYNYFHTKPQVGGPGVRSGVKRQSVHDHVPVNNANELSSPVPKRSIHAREDEPMQTASQENETAARRRGGTMDDRCQMCNNKVYLLERHISSTGRLYHRHCFRGYQRGSSIHKKVPDEKENVTPPSSSSSLPKLSSGQFDTTQANKIPDGLSSLTSKQSDKSRDETFNISSTKPSSSSCSSNLEVKSLLSTKPCVVTSVSGSETSGNFSSKPFVGQSAYSEANTALSTKPPANNSTWESRTIINTKANVNNPWIPEVKSSLLDSTAVGKSSNQVTNSVVSTRPVPSSSPMENKSNITTRPTVNSTSNPGGKSAVIVSPYVNESSNPGNKSTVSTNAATNNGAMETRTILNTKATVNSNANLELRSTFSPSPVVSKTSNPDIRNVVSTRPTANNITVEPRSTVTIKPTVNNSANPEVKSTFSVSPTVSKTSNSDIRSAVSTRPTANNFTVEPRSTVTIKPTVNNSATPEVKSTFSVSPVVSKTSNPDIRSAVSTRPTANNITVEPRSIVTIKPTVTVSNTANPEVKSTFSVSPTVSKTSNPDIRSAVSTRPTANNITVEPRSIVTIKPTVSNTANPEAKKLFSGYPPLNKSSNPEIRGAVLTTPVSKSIPMESKNTFTTKTTASALVESSSAFQPRTTSSSTNLLTALYSTPGYKANTASNDHSWSVKSTSGNDKETHPFRKTAISSSTNVNDSARRPLFASSTAMSSLTMTTNATTSKATDTKLYDTPEKKRGINNNYDAEITLGGLASSIGLISVSKSQVVTSKPSSTTNGLGSNVPSITSVSFVTSSAFGFGSLTTSSENSKVVIVSTNTSVASSGTKSFSPKYSTNVEVSPSETSFYKKYSTPSIVSSGASRTLIASSTSVVFTTPQRINQTVENSSPTSSNSSTSHLTINGRAESTSVTWSNPWSSSTTPSSESLRAKSSAPIIMSESSSDESSKVSIESPFDEGKSTGERRTCEKDQEIVAGLLQKLAEVRAEKLRGSKTLGRNSVNDGPPVIKTGRSIGNLENVVTPKVTVVTSTGESARGHSGVLTSSGRFDVGTRIVTCTSTTKTPNVVVSTSAKTEWQLEAERRAAERRGGYVDPEKKMKQKPEMVRQQPWQLASGVTNPVVSAGNEYAEPRTKYGAPEQQQRKSLIKESTPLKIPVDDRFLNTSEVSKSSVPQATTSCPSNVTSHHVISSLAPATKDEERLVVRRQILVPQLPTPIQHKITDSSEPAVPVDVILSRLDELDKQLQVMESKGRELEEKIRGGSDDAMDEDKDSVMGMWFDLIKQRNELVREESYLMYKRRQQELEQLHEELEYQLRCLLEKPEEMKSPQDKRHEDKLLSELVETVSLRNSIIDSMESDRIRYLEEDQKLEAMMASSGLSDNKDSGKRRNSKVKKKKHTFAEKQGHPEEKTKSKKKLFKFMTGKKSVPNTDPEAADVH